jgi:hypothetical protein
VSSLPLESLSSVYYSKDLKMKSPSLSRCRRARCRRAVETDNSFAGNQRRFCKSARSKRRRNRSTQHKRRSTRIGLSRCALLFLMFLVGVRNCQLLSGKKRRIFTTEPTSNRLNPKHKSRVRRRKKRISHSHICSLSFARLVRLWTVSVILKSRRQRIACTG